MDRDPVTGSVQPAAIEIPLSADAGPDCYFGNGWSRPERDFTWAIGAASWLLLPAVADASDVVLRFDAFPHVRRPYVERQRLLIYINGFSLGEFSLSGRQTISTLVPAHAVSGKTAICVLLCHPDHAQPIAFPNPVHQDSRSLAIAYRSLSIQVLNRRVPKILEEIKQGELLRAAAINGVDVLASDPDLSMNEVLRHFESCGDDCEFGMMQRKVGKVEQVGLFRFASVSLESLIKGLNRNFSDIASDQNLEIIQYADEHDYMGREKNYGMLYHIYRYKKDTDADSLLKTEIKRLRFLARKFLEDIESGDKLLVIKKKDGLAAFEVAELLDCVRTRGSATIFWVSECDAQNPAGSAYWVCPGLIRGFVDRFDVSPLQNISHDSWASACRAAFAVWRTTRPAETGPRI